MIEQTNDPEQWAEFWSTPHATEAPFLEAPHSHGCALTSRGGACDCALLVSVIPCTCAWPGSRCEYPHAAQDGPGAPSSPQPGTRGGSRVFQGLTGAHSAVCEITNRGHDGRPIRECSGQCLAAWSRGIDYSALNDAVWVEEDE